MIAYRFKPSEHYRSKVLYNECISDNMDIVDLTEYFTTDIPRDITNQMFNILNDSKLVCGFSLSGKIVFKTEANMVLFRLKYGL